MYPGASIERLRVGWDEVAVSMSSPEGPLWRRQSDAVLTMLLDRWLPADGLGPVLKTDLFDEVAGAGLFPALRARTDRVVGIDLSPAAVERASARYPELEAVAADVRALPFEDGIFDAVVSNSTLDHLDDGHQVGLALRELARVLRRGGRLVLTLDNPLNPLLAARNRLPPPLAGALRRVPYGVGWTCGPRALRRLVSRAGFRVGEQTAVVHFPRVALAAMGAGPRGHERGWTHLFRAAEQLERLPSRYLTGHFVALAAVRLADGER